MFVNKMLVRGLIVLTFSSVLAAAHSERSFCPGEPFAARGSATSVVVKGGPPPAPLFFEIAAAGNATYLGRYTSNASFTVIFVSPAQAVFVGEGTLTGEGGDQVRFVMAGEFLPGATPGGLGGFIITGGTGQFRGARGGGRFASVANETTFDGCIRFRRRA